jgi:hypothetical protein
MKRHAISLVLTTLVQSHAARPASKSKLFLARSRLLAHLSSSLVTGLSTAHFLFLFFASVNFARVDSKIKKSLFSRLPA